jgi:molecular chaperone DnaJ
MAEDLYGILGLSKGASDADIKSAYKKAARKYHPDVNKDPGAEDTFKKVQKAYSILSDPQKKQQYDHYGVADDSPGGQGGFGGFSGGFGGFESGGFEDIFDSFFGGGGKRSRGNQGYEGEDLRYDLELTLEEVQQGVDTTISIYHLETESGSKKRFDECDGFGQIRITQRTMLGMIQQVTNCPHCHGQGCIKRNKKKKDIQVKIPAGVDSDTKLRVRGEGNQGANPNKSGDLYVYIKVKKHKFFKRENNNVYLTLELPFTQLILGCNIEVPVLNGTADLKIPKGTQPNTSFRLKGKGIPSLQGYGTGDQFIKVLAELPKYISKREEELINELSEIRKENISGGSAEKFIVKQ